MGHKRARPGQPVVHPVATAASPPAARASQTWLASLRERKVVQWTLAYAAATAALLQVLALVAAQFNWPEAVGRSATVLLACGLPVAAVIAWYHGDRGAQRIAGMELLVLAAILAGTAGLLWWTNAGPEPAGVAHDARTMPTPLVPRLAVLPFDNLSPDPANAFFADGLHDELLTALSKLGSIEVVSRTTMLGYRDQRPATRKLAADLGASHLLEGTVRREGDTVRLNLQLIDARADRHLWAESYTRRLDHTLALQDEVARGVANELNARIAPATRAATPAVRVDPRAVDAYLQARAISVAERTDALERRRALLDSALAIAPEFGAARAERASVLAQTYWAAKGDAKALREQAVSDLEAARRLAPHEPATAAAEIEFTWYFERDLERALEKSGKARARWPQSALLAHLRSQLCRRLGRYSEALALNEVAVRLDPRNDEPLFGLLILHSSVLRDYEGALALSHRLHALKPSPENRRNVAVDQFLLDGDMAARLDAYARIDSASETEGDTRFALERRWYIAERSGDWNAADAAAAQWPTEYYGTAGDGRFPVAINRLFYAVQRGDDVAARRFHAQALAFLERESARTADPDSVLYPRAWASAIAGDHAAARPDIARVLARSRREPDRSVAAADRRSSVPVLAAIGERDAALELLRASLAEPWGTHAAEVINDPYTAWAFGDHAGFKALLAELRTAIGARASRWRAAHPQSVR